MSTVIEARTELRLQFWQQLIAEKGGMDIPIREFCLQKGVTTGAYYYWLRKIRESILQDIACTEDSSMPPQFVRLPDLPAMPQKISEPCANVYYGNFHVAIDSAAPRKTILKVLSVVKELED